MEDIVVDGFDKSKYDTLFTGVCNLDDELAIQCIHDKSIRLVICESEKLEQIKSKLEYDFVSISLNRTSKSKLLDLISKTCDDLDYILILDHKKELLLLYVYLQSKGYKIMLPVGDEPELLKLLQSKDILYNAQNKYNAQQKLFI